MRYSFGSATRPFWTGEWNAIHQKDGTRMKWDFSDFYIIPLAKKLKDCGVFGVSSDEFRNYALANRKEWELKGESMVKDNLQYFDNVKE
ncbi:hypothetical protein IV203_032448 [Nitzschia inconspicua]|uniref:Uncharacterized protein n=1 Tax=Nitzschia inconspicua TaxID=303405 RepID=A0A9K3KJQ7_9STRA|nr:hypothetical protein IV203_032448 [Nitzschia inconspicua]